MIIIIIIIIIIIVINMGCKNCTQHISDLGLITDMQFNILINQYIPSLPPSYSTPVHLPHPPKISVRGD